MKFTMVRSAVITASLLACSATASDPTQSKSLLSQALPVAGGSDFGSAVAKAISAMPTRRDQVEADSGTDAYAHCKFQLWSGFVSIGDDQQIDFAFAQRKKPETTGERLPRLELPSSRARDDFRCGRHDKVLVCLSKGISCGGATIFTHKFTVPEWLPNIFRGLPEDMFDDQSVAADDHPKREDGEHDGKKSEYEEGHKGLTNIGSATTVGALALLLVQAVPVFLALW